MNNLLVICIGNICRSPIAEALLISKLANTHPNIKVSSAGLGALINRPADPISQELMLERGIDISQHRAKQFTPELAFASDLILTMNTEQQQEVEKKLPSMCGRVHRLGKWGGFDIPDPFKRPREIFEQAFVLIDQGVDEWYRSVWA